MTDPLPTKLDYQSREKRDGDGPWDEALILFFMGWVLSPVFFLVTMLLVFVAGSWVAVVVYPIAVLAATLSGSFGVGLMACAFQTALVGLAVGLYRASDRRRWIGPVLLAGHVLSVAAAWFAFDGWF